MKKYLILSLAVFSVFFGLRASPVQAATPPVVTTVSSTAITTTTATFNGTLVNLGGTATVTVSFEYATSAAYAVSGFTNTTTGSVLGLPGSYSRNVTGLACGTSYVFRAKGFNSAGSGFGANMTFVTSVCTPPSVTTNPATAIGLTTATLNGALTALGTFPNANVYFKYGTTSGFTSGSTTTPLVTVSVLGPFSRSLTGLSCNTTYYYRAYADAGVTTVSGAELSFTTPYCLPTVTTLPAISVTDTAATLQMTGVTMGGDTGPAAIIGFDYGLTTSYGLSPSVPYMGGSPASVVTTTLAGLVCGTTYHYRAFATNSAGTTYGADMTFTTLPCLSTVVTNPATAITALAATLNGNLVTLASPSVGVYFKYSTTSGFTTGVTTTPSVTVSATGAFSAPIAGLSCGTTYYYRAYADAGSGVVASGVEISFSSSPCLPSVITLPATSVTSSAAVFNGNATSFGSATDANASFDYGTTTSYGAMAGSSYLTATGPFSISATGLYCDTTYHYRAHITNSSGDAYGADMTFTTLPCPAPLVITYPASAVLANTAMFNGEVPSVPITDGPPFSAGFEYGLTASYGSTVVTSPATTGGLLSHAATGLACTTTYHYRAFATNISGITGYGADMTFTTIACPPVVITNPATAIASTSATINGSLTSLWGHLTLDTYFKYGTTSGFTSGAITTPTVTVSAAGPYSALITGLSCGTTYYFRAYADNGSTEAPWGSFGTELSFTTTLCLPSVTTNAATSVVMASASLENSITDFGGAASVTSGFDYGMTTAYGSASPVITVPSSVGIPNFNNAIISGLSCGTTYHYRAWATNSAGTGYGADMTFTTDPCPLAVTTDSVTAISMSGATLHGDLTSMGGLSSVGVLFRYGLTSGSMSGGITTPTVTVTATGPFTTVISGLACNTVYYFHAYAVGGASTSIDGGELSFTTLPCFPTVTTDASSAITGTGATLAGTLVGLGGTASGTLGFLYSTDMSFGSSIAGTPGTLTAPGSFTASLTSLACNTAYNFKAFATTSAGTSYGAVLSFTTSPCPATVMTLPATGMSMFGATFGGDLTSLGGAASATLGFEYGPSFASSISGTPGTLSTTGTFNAPVTGLSCGTTYSYRATATTSAGIAYGLTQTFATDPCPPAVVTTAATALSATTATLNGDLTSLGSASTVHGYFRYSTTSGFTSGATVTPGASLSATGPFSNLITGLVCNTTYYYRAYADAGLAGIATGAELSFTTTPCAATVTTNPATLVTPTSATLNGTLGSLGGAPSAALDFEYGPTASFGSTSPALPATLTATGSFSVPLIGFTCNTTYYYRAYATTSAGTTYGATLTFTTSFCLPTVTTLPPGAVGLTSGTPQGLPGTFGGAPSATVGFEYGLTTAYGSTATGPTVTSLTAFGLPITGLSCGTTYHYRAFITTSAGTGYGGDMTMTTSACPPPVVNTLFSASVTTTTATINGNLVSLATALSADVYFKYGTTSGFTSGSTTTPSTTLSAPGMFFEPLTGLACNTTYYYRAYANGGSIGTGIGAELSFTTGMCPPTVVTLAAVSIGTNSATIGGDLIDLGGAPSGVMTVHYGTTPSLGTVAGTTTLTSPSGLGIILTTLPCGATIYHQASAVTVVGTAYGALLNFDTLPCGVPTVITGGSSGIASAWATLDGTLTGVGGFPIAVVGFQYGTTTSYGMTVTGSPSPISGGTFSALATGLTCNTLYHYRATGNNVVGTGYGADMAFTSGACPPVVVTTGATVPTLSTATLNGNLTALGTSPSAIVYFKYGTTSGFTSGSVTTPGVTVTATGPFSAPLAGLACGTTYYYRAYANAGSAGIVNGIEMSFSTASCYPVVVTDPPTSISSTGATLKGHLVSMGASTSVMVGIEYGPTMLYGTSVAVLSPYTAPGPIALGTVLTCGTTYHYRAWAMAPSGVYHYGIDMPFVTGACPLSVTTTPVSGGGGGAVLLNGNLTSLGSAVSVSVGFQFGTTTAYGTTHTASPTMTAAGAFSFPKVVSCGKTYHYRAYASGVSGIAYGADQTFIIPLRNCLTAPNDNPTSTSTTGGVGAAGLVVYPPTDANQAQVEYFTETFPGIDPSNVALTNINPFVRISSSVPEDVDAIEVGKPFILNWETYQVAPGTCRGVSDPRTDGWSMEFKEPVNASQESELEYFSVKFQEFAEDTTYTLTECTDYAGNILPDTSVTVTPTREAQTGRLRWRVY